MVVPRAGRLLVPSPLQPVYDNHPDSKINGEHVFFNYREKEKQRKQLTGLTKKDD
jgi:hypothetical protein